MNAAAANTPVQSAAHTTREFFPGDVLDAKYRLDAVLGAGAMGQVWRAHNIMLDMPVAIKIVRPDAHGHAAMDRLLTEARLEAQLQHPNIVRVIDVRTGLDLSYIVMELLAGCTLADLMDQGPLPPALAIRLFLPLLAGLRAAHEAGIVHRDIKPENVFIGRGVGGRPCPKLLDFGIARSEAVTPRRARVSRIVLGTPGYMSPEQAWGDDCVDQRADIWAMGIVLYEAVSGCCAFECNDYDGFLRALDSSELKPLAGANSAELWTIIQRATNRTCAERYPSSVEFSEALASFLRKRGVSEDLAAYSLPEHWATPGSMIDRAWRTDEAMRRSSLARAASECLTARRALDDVRVDRRVSPEADAPTSSKIRAVARPPRKPRSNWQVLSFVAGGVLGVTLSFARLHGGDTTPKAPQLQQVRAVETRVQPATHAATPVAPTPVAVEPPVLKEPTLAESDATEHKTTKASPKGDGATHRWKTKRAYANNTRTWPSTQKRAVLQREAAELGLKTPR